MDGLTLVNAVLISHGNKKPFVITTTKTDCWGSELNTASEIVRVADIKRCKSLCVTHFAHILGKFPEKSFCKMHAGGVEQAKNLTGLKQIVVDKDKRYIETAKAVHQQVEMQISGKG